MPYRGAHFKRDYRKVGDRMKPIETRVTKPDLHLTSFSFVVSQALEGTASIRTFQKEGMFAIKFRQHVNLNTSAMLNFVAAERWLGLRIELLGASIAFALSTAIVCGNGRFQIAPGVVGFVIQWGLVFSAALNFFFLRLSESEARITSVERVYETSHLKAQEAAWETNPSAVTLDEQWPQRGEVTFERYVAKSRQLALLLLNESSTQSFSFCAAYQRFDAISKRSTTFS